MLEEKVSKIHSQFKYNLSNVVGLIKNRSKAAILYKRYQS